jgi:hypothetical protein
MTNEEAREWLKGDRSLCNSIGSSDPDRWQVLIAQADAAMMEQAYWFLKADKEGLLGDKP